MYRLFLSTSLILLLLPQEKHLLAKDILKHLLPQQVNDWKPIVKDEIYGSGNLHEYIDGAAELYISYGFKKMITRIYQKQGQPDIIAEIFDMGSAANAFGIFSHSREIIDTTFGQGSQYTAGLLLFWKDRFYVSILCSPESEITKKAVFRLAAEIERAIPQTGALPEVLQLLPGDSLIEESVRYFRHPVWVNTYYFISDRNLLHINEETEAVLAKYGQKKDGRVALIVRYPKKDEAQTAFKDFTEAFLPELKQQAAVQIEDGRWATAGLYEDVIVTILNAGTEEQANTLLKKIVKQLPAPSVKR